MAQQFNSSTKYDSDVRTGDSMLTIHICNDGTGTKAIGNYDVEVRANSELLWQGRVEGHRRELPWQHLVEQVLCAARGVPRKERR